MTSAGGIASEINKAATTNQWSLRLCHFLKTALSVGRTVSDQESVFPNTIVSGRGTLSFRLATSRLATRVVRVDLHQFGMQKVFDRLFPSGDSPPASRLGRILIIIVVRIRVSRVVTGGFERFFILEIITELRAFRHAPTAAGAAPPAATSGGTRIFFARILCPFGDEVVEIRCIRLAIRRIFSGHFGIIRAGGPTTATAPTAPTATITLFTLDGITSRGCRS